jgi:hypothetical protein
MILKLLQKFQNIPEAQKFSMSQRRLDLRIQLRRRAKHLKQAQYGEASDYVS